MARNGETFDMKFNVRNTYIPELRGFIYNETHLSHILCISSKNIYHNQNVKKSINTYVLQSLQIVILKEHETKSM